MHITNYTAPIAMSKYYDKQISRGLKKGGGQLEKKKEILIHQKSLGVAFPVSQLLQNYLLVIAVS